MRLAEQWAEIRAGLPDGWEGGRLSLVVAEDVEADRAALILGPLTPGRTGSTFQLYVGRGSDPSRVFARLDQDGISGRIELAAAERAAEERTPTMRTGSAPAPARRRVIPLAAQWDELLARLPPDWSDLYAEVELESSDFLERGALLLGPVNPARDGSRLSFRFRCARTQGYGVAAKMARRCLERLDGERITGRVRILRVLSRTSLVATQGPVWYVGGKAV